MSKDLFGPQGDYPQEPIERLDYLREKEAQRNAEAQALIGPEPIEAYSAEAVPVEQRSNPDLLGTPQPSETPRLDPQPPFKQDLRTTVPGTGKSGLAGTVEGTVGPQVDPALYAAQAELAARNAAIQKLGLQAQADAIGLQIDVMREIEPLWEADFEQTREQVQGLLDEAQEGTDAIQGMIEAAQSDQINPGQFFANVGGAGRFAAALAVGVGAMATAFGGGPNVALGIIQSAIDRSVRARLANQQHNRALIGHQVNYINTLRGIASNRQEFSNYLRVGYTALAQSKFAQISAGLSQSQALLAKHDVDNRLQAMLVDSQIKAQEALRQKVTFKFKTMAQYGQAMRALGNRPALGAGGGAAPLATRAAKRGAAPAIDTSQIKTVKDVKDAFRRASAQGVAEPQLAEAKQRLIEHYEAQGEGGQAFATQIRGLGRMDLLAPEHNAPISVSVAGVGARAYTDETFAGLKGKARGDAIAAVSNAATSYKYALDIYTLLDVGSFSTRQSFTQHIRQALGDRYLFPVRSKEAAAVLGEIDRKALEIEEIARANERTRNAINTEPEMRRQGQRYAATTTLGEALVDYVWNNKELRKNRYKSVLELLRNRLDTVERSNGIYIQWRGQ